MNAKQRVLDFVEGSWDGRDDERQEAIGCEDDEPRNIEQSRLLDRLPPERLGALDRLRALVQEGSLLLMDKQTMVPFTASGFYVLEDGRVVLFHER